MTVVVMRSPSVAAWVQGRSGVFGMRVLVLGGAGGMGRVAVRQSAAYSFVERVTVADLDGARAADVAAHVGSKAAGIALNVNDREAMRAAISGHDLVLNTVGPFYAFGVSVLEQVIEAGCNYADVCDDWEPTIEMLALDARARDAGVSALIGLGASPGITNMLAMKAIASLDEVDEVLTGWSIDGSSEDAQVTQSSRPHSAGASAAVVHWVQQLTGSIRVLRDGGFQDVKPLEQREINYPGYGPLSVWSVGHPEAVTIPRVRPDMSACSNVMVGQADAFQGLQLLSALVDSGRLTIHQAADEIARDFAKNAKPPREPRSESAAPGLFAWASGRVGGRRAISAAAIRSLPRGGMAGATSVPLSLAIPLFRIGFSKHGGVFAPEDVVDPDVFFDLLAPHCVGAFRTSAELIALSTEIAEA